MRFGDARVYRYKDPHPLGWHKWFAWHPVSVNDKWVWLETVERNGWWWEPCEPVCGGRWHWDYR